MTIGCQTVIPRSPQICATLLLVLFLFSVFVSGGVDYASFGTPLTDNTCNSASPPSLAWSYRLFGNLTLPQALRGIDRFQVPTDPRVLVAADPRSSSCIFGVCDSSSHTCKCGFNWVGPKCQWCSGRTLWSDREGIVASSATNYNYADNSRCTWIITPPPLYVNSSLQLRLLNFSTECSWDLLFIFDGTTAISQNLLAVISGDLSNEQLTSYPIIYSKTGSFLIYFYSDAFLNYAGFTLEYTFSNCLRNCSGHGVCPGYPSSLTFTMTYSNGSMSSIPTTTTPSYATPFSTSGVTSSNSKCNCDSGYTGESCDHLACPNNCSSENGTCMADGTCRCHKGFAGLDCSVDASRSSGYWNILTIQAGVSTKDANRAPGAGGASVFVESTHDDISPSVWLFGGFDFASRFGSLPIRKFDLISQSFSNILTGNSILNRYGHSAVIRQDLNAVYLFGGTLTWSNRVTSELVLFNMSNLTFTVISGGRYSAPLWRSQPSALTGHTAHVINKTQMYVFFGYSPDYGLSDWVRIYDFNTSTWHVEQAPFGGRAWHSSVYDAMSGSVYVYGGFAASRKRSSVDITGDLLRYDLNANSWHQVGQLPFRRAFHAAVLLPSLQANLTTRHMLVHGGTMHETTTSTKKSQQDSDACYVTRPIVYDLDTGCSIQIADASAVGLYSTSRISHKPIVYNSSVIYFGGFDGTIIDNRLLQFVPVECESRSRPEDCAVLNGYSCLWVCGQCYPSNADLSMVECSVHPILPYSIASCSTNYNTTTNTTHTRSCSEKTSCASCINFDPSDDDSCQWLAGELCISYKQTATTTAVQDVSQPDYGDSVSSMIQMQSLVKDADQCPTSCNSLNDCYTCTKQTSCLWCNNLALCLPSDAYRIAFPYGQCQDWTMSADSCRTNCSSYKSCADCQQDLRCGWCDDGSGTGTGTCMVGGLKSAINNTLTNTGCPTERWYFSTCPLCQCSGHSTCYNGTSDCISCGDNTQGTHCESCISGYFGSALNGGTCQRCQCNNHATVCDNQSGVCKCDTQGISGPHCDQCDKTYEGDAIWGTCYYPIQSGYRYTMDLTKKDMQYINKINFQTKDKLGRNEVNFKLNCTKLAAYVLSYATGAMVNSSETILQSGSCGPDLPIVEIAISPTGGVPFSEPNFRFRIAISNFTYPFLITLVATEEQPFLIYLLLIAVFGCFLVVLVIAIIVFQIKRRYDEYHRRQQVKIELRRMAKRPFAMINFLILRPHAYSSSLDSGIGSRHRQSFAWEQQQESNGSYNGESSRKMMLSNMVSPFPPRSPPMPVTLQPMSTPGAAIMTVLIQLPLVAAAPSDPSDSTSTEVPLGAPSALAAGSVIVRAASNLLSDLSNRGKQTAQPQAATVAAESTLCASSAAAQYSLSTGRGTGAVTNESVMFNNEPVSPVIASGSRRSSRQTCWNTPPGSINARPPGLSVATTGSTRAASASTVGGDNPGAPPAPSAEPSMDSHTVTLRPESHHDTTSF